MNISHSNILNVPAYYSIETKYGKRYFFDIQANLIKTDLSFWLPIVKIHEN